jgi:hypothetical protein
MRSPRMAIRIVALVVAAIGVWLLLQGPELGTRAADALLTRAGGMDTGKYLALVEGFVSAYRWLGAILTALGLYRASEGWNRIE